jgi:hypothetical protein
MENILITRTETACSCHWQQIEGQTATLTLNDIGTIIFGGDVIMSDGSTLTLIKAFELAFDPAHICHACEKCGYLPSMWAALKNPKIRHEIVEGEDGKIDVDADPLGVLYDMMEKDNHEAVAVLLAAGCLFEGHRSQALHSVCH